MFKGKDGRSIMINCRILFVLIVLCSFFEVNGQKIDSLKKVLQLQKEDTLKADLYHRIFQEYLNVSNDSADYFAKKELELSQKLMYQEGILCAYNALGMISFYRGDYDEAIKNFYNSLHICETIKDKPRTAVCYANIGNVLVRNTDYKEAIEYYSKALEVYKSLNDQRRIAALYLNLGVVCKEMKRTDEALKWYELCIAKSRELGYDEELVNAYNNLGVLYEEIDKSKALSCYKTVLGLEKEIGNKYGVATIGINIGDLLNKQKKFEEALPFLLSGLDYVMNEGDKDWILSAYSSLADTYTGLKDYEKANVFLYRHKVLNDSLFNEAKSKQISELQTKYDMEKKRQNILFLEEQNKTVSAISEKRKLWVITVCSFAAILLLTLVLIITINRNKKKQKEIAFIKTKAELEQTALLAQMNPHFIFNALNSIQYYILSKETEYAYDYLAKFSKLIRQVLINSEQNTIALNKEIETLQLYIELEQRRLKNRFDFEINCSNDFPAHDITIPTMLIQPFVENAIWHGIMNMPEEKKGKLTLSFNLEGKQLKIAVEDNGVGRREAALRKLNNEYKSVGVMFTQKRLELIRAVNKQHSEIAITDLVNDKGNAIGTRVEIIIEVAA